MNNQFTPNVRKKVYLPKKIVNTKHKNKILNKKERREEKRLLRGLKDLEIKNPAEELL